MKTKYKLAHLQAAHLYAELSTARRLKVGALVVKDDSIISIGYNSQPSGWDNNCEIELEDGTLKTKPTVLHAEMNAISKLAKSNESGDGSSIFTTHAPCIDCAKMIYQSGITNVYYAVDYRDTAGKDFLKQCGIKIEKLDV